MKMNNSADATPIAMPRLIPSITTGLGVVANNIWIILFPICLDLLLWFGPHLRAKTLMEPLFIEFIDQMSNTNSIQAKEVLPILQQSFLEYLNHFNLFSSFSTFPIGIPSLLTPNWLNVLPDDIPGLISPIKTPLGDPLMIEVSSGISFVLLWLVITLLGLLLGSIFFYQLAHLSSRNPEPFSFILALRQWLQVLLFMAIITILGLVLLIPVITIFAIFTIINQSIAQIAFLLLMLVAVWLLMPLVFCLHGVFAYRQNLGVSTLTSIRLVRHFLPGTGMFILTALLINQGLNNIWMMPPETSWIAAVGIFGHAFISSGLLAASFVYYRNGIRWMEENLRLMAASRSEPPADTPPTNPTA